MYACVTSPVEAPPILSNCKPQDCWPFERKAKWLCFKIRTLKLRVSTRASPLKLVHLVLTSWLCLHNCFPRVEASVCCILFVHDCFPRVEALRMFHLQSVRFQLTNQTCVLRTLALPVVGREGNRRKETSEQHPCRRRKSGVLSL